MTLETAAALDTLQQIVSSAPRGISHSYLDSIIATREQALGLAPGTFAQTSQTTAVTDAAGYFSFKNQAPGVYAIRAGLDGYFGPAINGAPATTITKSVTVEAQKTVPPIDISMAKGGIITGRIRDPNGQAIAGMTVAATRLTYSNGRPQWVVVASKATDDRGEFRIFWVSPGEYFVGAPFPAGASAVPLDSWTRTFFPGVTDPTTATPLVLKDGADISRIDFTVQKIAATSTYTISGTATNPLAVPNATTGFIDRYPNTFLLSPRELANQDSVTQQFVQNAIPLAARPNGEFEIHNVPPGDYDLYTYYLSPPAPDSGTTRDYVDRARVTIRDADVKGINLQIQKGAEIRGKVVSQPATSLPLEKIRLNLHSQDSMPEAFAAIVGTILVDAAGNFSASDIPSGRYSLQVTGLSETAYVADIRQSGTSSYDTGFVVGSSSALPLEIAVNANGGTIEGNIQTSDRKPAAGATVVLVPPAGQRQNAMRYKTTKTDAKGNFSMNGVPPGEFTLLAWETVLPTAWMNAAFLDKYQNRGQQIAVTPGTRMNVQLDLIEDH